MGFNLSYVLSIAVFLAMTSSAQATVACSVLASAGGVESARLYSDPDAASEILRDIPLDDLVLYPDVERAPQQIEGWVWVRHDITQEAIWQAGLYG